MNLDTVTCCDWRDLLATLEPGSVDLLLTDMPYGKTQVEWDNPPDLAVWWQLVHPLMRSGGAVVCTATQPFTSQLVVSGLDWFRYEWIWRKSNSVGHLNAHIMPLQQHESILVFGEKTPDYYPQLRDRVPHGRTKNGTQGAAYGTFHQEGVRTIEYEQGYPSSVVDFNTCYHDREAGLHPTQKPLALFEYLIRTYTLPDDLVVDPFCGSGTTALAARNLGRFWICGDLDRHYVDVSLDRLRMPFEACRVPPASAPLEDLPMFARPS
jgi:site-specific DNA-methyltransferase (adenine-specific)